ncbi:hypothetical protein MKZ38_001129 [Zalerion maritima]|uniref:Uncharacterized protein n=1 Tax=Zalerion maritima TaxID=339359 RepID=A0AAD5RS75_9PEZI|nr:hypothetical protein MKZ38_001129 [Zalerion maritima]
MIETVKELLSSGNGSIMVDEPAVISTQAHSAGLYGHNGSGCLCDLGAEKDCAAGVYFIVHLWECRGMLWRCPMAFQESAEHGQVREGCLQKELAANESEILTGRADEAADRPAGITAAKLTQCLKPQTTTQ